MALVGAFVVPHPPLAVAEVGHGDEKQIQATLDAYGEVASEIARLKPETIVVLSPHSVMYRNYFHISPGRSATGDFGRFRAPQVRFSETYDEELVAELTKRCEKARFPAGFEGEQEKALDHGTMVPLYFIRQQYSDFWLVRIGLSGLPLKAHRDFGMLLNEAIEKLSRRTVLVASGDLSHCQKEDGPYGFAPEGPIYDEKLMEVLKRGALEELFEFPEELLNASMECGHRAFCIMAGALAGKEYETKVLSHEATFGVGYGIVTIKVG